MKACTRSSCARRSGSSTSGRERRPRARCRRGPRGRRGRARRRRAGPGRRSSAPVSSRTMPGEVRPQPRHAAELQRVRDLVQRDPAQEPVGVGVELRRRVAEVRAPRTAAAPARRGRAPGTRTGPSTRPARKPEIAPASTAEHGARGGAGDAAERARAPRRPSRRRARARRASSARFASIHGSRSTPRRPAARPRRHEPGVAATSALGLVRRAHERLERLGVARRLEAGDALGDLGARCQSTIHPGWQADLSGLSAAGRAPAPRAPSRASAPRRRRRPAPARRAARRAASAQPGNATCPPASRTISCAGGDVDRAAAAQRDHPVEPRGRDLAQRHGDRARSRAAGARRRRARRADVARPSAGRPTRRRAAPAGRATRRSGTRRVERHAVEQRAAAARRATHSSPAPKSCTKREHDVGHRRPVGDGDRERVVGQPALGVLRAVDRVDDDAHVRPPPKSTWPRSSLTAVKRWPSACSASSRPNTAASAAASISSVRSPPSPRVPVSRARSAVVGARGEHVAQLPRGAARGAEPVRCAATLTGRILRRCPRRTTLRSARRSRTRGGPLLVLGGRGHRQDADARRALRLARRRRATPAGGDPRARPSRPRPPTTLRERIEERRVAGRATRSSSVTTFAGLLRAAAARRGARGGRRPVRHAGRRAADRLAMLLERIDELPLASHDLRGNPSALLGSIVAPDRPAQGRAGHRRGLRRLGRDAAGGRRDRRGRARRASASSPPSTPPTTGMLAEARDARRRRPRAPRVPAPARASRTSARGSRRATATCSSTSSRTRTSPRTCCCGCSSPSTATSCVAADDDAGDHRFRGASTKNIADFRAEWPEARRRAPDREPPLPARGSSPPPPRWSRPIRTGSRSGSRRRTDAARRGRVLALRERARAGAGGRRRRRAAGRARGRRAGGRLRARPLGQAARARRSPSRWRSARSRTGSSGAAAFFQRAEVRDLLAWLRLLVDPGDAGAVVRALARPPIELRAIDLARCTQIARRRKLDMVAALGAALESPQIPPEARERIAAFLKLYRAAAGAIDSTRPDLYVHRLIERLGLRRQLLFAASTEVVERLVNLAKFAELAADYLRRSPQATAREFARSIAAVADAGPARGGGGRRRAAARRAGDGDARGARARVRPRLRARADGRAHARPAPAHARADPGRADQGGAAARHEGRARRRDAAAAARRDDPRAAAARARLPGGAPSAARSSRRRRSPRRRARRSARSGRTREEELFGPAETLQSTFRLLRDELLDHGRAGRRPARRAALRHRPRRLARRRALPRGAQARGADGAHARRRPDRRGGAAGGQRAAAAGRDRRAARDLRDLGARRVPARRRARREAARAGGRRSAPSRRWSRSCPSAATGSCCRATDIETYRTCPLQVQVRARLPDPVGADAQPALRDPRPPGARALPRRRRGRRGSLPELLGLLEAGWRRGGFGDSEEERQLRGKATHALLRYHERFQDEDAEPVWFERAFSFQLGPHLLRGRVDRVDRLPDGGYELIDYKTGRPKTADAAARGRPALALRGRRARGVAARGRPPGLLLRARRREGPGRALRRATATGSPTRCSRSPRGSSAQGFEPTPS